MGEKKKKNIVIMWCNIGTYGVVFCIIYASQQRRLCNYVSARLGYMYGGGVVLSTD
jgi:hypothetical protein